MTHCSDDDLVLHYYGEASAAAEHLMSCGECAGRYRELAAVLQTVSSIDEPQRDERYGFEVWQRIQGRLLPEPWWRRAWSLVPAWSAGPVPLRWAAVGAAAIVLLVAGFTVGRVWPPASPRIATAPSQPHQDRDHVDRVLLLTVADHLERSERVLTDIINAPAGLDISAEQQWADDLVAASRLYRQEAAATDQLSVVAVLDELERTLLEIVHRPSQVTEADLEEIRRRVESASLLFKVRVMSSELLRELTEGDEETSVSAAGRIG